jgi:cytochrome c biogenesis protein CcmG/thiol:disulfide interchange protein DsbE
MTQSQDKFPAQSGAAWVAYLAMVVAAVAIIAAIVAFLQGLGPPIAPSVEENPINPGVGKRFTGLKLKPLVGDLQPISSADVQGQVVLLNFWGPWCPPCRQELPHMAALAKRFADRMDFRLAAISYPPGGQPGDVQVLRDDTVRVLKELGLELSVYYDPDSASVIAIDPLIGFQGFPTSVLLDRQGVIRAVWVGYRSGIEDEIEQQVDKLLSEPADEQK